MSNRFTVDVDSNDPLVKDGIAIWCAGVDSILGNKAVNGALAWDGRWLAIESSLYDLSHCKRILVVGAGKATAAMTNGLVDVFDRYPEMRPEIHGWINVPDGTFLSHEPRSIHFHAARPAGMNEPTQAAFDGSKSIMRLVSEADPEDLVICLISGGASALLPFPVDGVSLEDKIFVTRLLSRRGANIEQLNCVRRSLSQIKAGGLARACTAKKMVTLILSDVLGDPLHMIGSGPTWLESPSDPKEAVNILKQFDPTSDGIPSSIHAYLARAISLSSTFGSSPKPTKVDHFVIGNNATAIDRAAQAATSMNYEVLFQPAVQCEGDVAKVAQSWLAQIRGLPPSSKPICLITGGEPTVCLPDSGPSGLGGRNQQLILHLLSDLLERPLGKGPSNWVFLSGGTDGEDGPTDAAGAWLSRDLLERVQQIGLNPNPFLATCNAYHFFRELGGLLLTGPTGTNVCDLRVALIK